MQFARHETFHIRDGWLHKGISNVSTNPEIFSDKYATDVLGIGKNMVSSLRYWLVALDLAREDKKKVTDSSNVHTVLSPLGKMLWRHDKFIEEDASLWALHYQLASNEKRATAWYWFFNKFPATRFDSQLCLNYLLRWVDQADDDKKTPKMSSLLKDINCILRTYTKTHGRKKTDFSPEDSFESPFASLQLVDYLENSDSYKLNAGKRVIPVHAFAYAVVQFIRNRPNTKFEVGFQELLLGENSPGRIFLLSDEGLLNNIDFLVEEFPKEFSFSKTAGLNTLRLKKEDTAALKLLELAYN